MKLLFSLFLFIGALVAGPTHAADTPLTDYSRLLHAYVSPGIRDDIHSTLVDYAAWQKDPLHAKAMATLQNSTPNTLTGKEKMAFWINAYNLLTIDLIITTGEKESIRNQGAFLSNVWKSHSWDIHGKPYTLDEIEHKILRHMGDPRIHMAINCASLSCPDLRSEPYIATILDTQLENQAMLFITNPDKGVRISSEGLTLSPIFKWFATDFGDEKRLLAFIHHRLPEHAAKKAIGQLDYNWRLNSK
jgi:hypothetical protein